MENSYIVLGNGFSIDLVQKMEKAEEIDLANLTYCATSNKLCENL